MPLIEWRRESRRIRLPIVILQAHPLTEVHGLTATALLDTGATLSGVAYRIAAALGLPGRGKIPISSVHGVRQVERFEFRVGLTPDYSPPSTPRFPFVLDQVIGLGLSDAFEFDALLGMDVLGQCDFAMNRRGACRLVFG